MSPTLPSIVPDEPVSVEVNAERVYARHKNVDPEVKLVAVDQKRVGDVALHNDGVFLDHFLLVFCVYLCLLWYLRLFTCQL